MATELIEYHYQAEAYEKFNVENIKQPPKDTPAIPLYYPAI